MEIEIGTYHYLHIWVFFPLLLQKVLWPITEIDKGRLSECSILISLQILHIKNHIQKFYFMSNQFTLNFCSFTYLAYNRVQVNTKRFILNEPFSGMN